MNEADEEAAERREMLKGLHPQMRGWYNSTEAAPIKAKYGDYPLFWQDLEGWPHLKLLRKLFLTVTERKESKTSYDVDALERAFVAEAAAPPPPPDVEEEGEATTTGTSSVAVASASGDGMRKRRSKWGTAPQDDGSNVGTVLDATAAAAVAAASAANASKPSSSLDDDDAAAKKQRRSRWSTAEDGPVVQTAGGAVKAPIAITQEVIQQTLVLKVQLQQVSDKMLTVVQDAARIEMDPNRPPSPAPKYDSNGKRTNTREVRMREELVEERAKIIEELIRINPQYQPPLDFVRSKPFRRIMIPYREYPTYNFIGLIIGPRGNTQKKLELETGCKISIRGKGSAKEGSKGRSTKSAEDEEDLHVHVTGDDPEKVAAAGKIIEDLLTPIDDDKNEHKQKQLRELALINGTLKEDEYCPVCGEKGHRQFECPHRAKTFKAAGVKCSICGDLSHPTRDCPLKKDEPASAVVDSEYDSFMAELGDGGGGRAGGGGGGGGGGSSSSHSSSGAGGGNGGIYGDAAGVDTAGGGKRQQTVIVCTTVLTGSVSLMSTTAAGAGGISTAPAGMYATTSPYMPPPPLSGAGPGQWNYGAPPSAPAMLPNPYDPYGQMYGAAYGAPPTQYYDYSAYAQHQQPQPPQQQPHHQQYGGGGGYFDYGAAHMQDPPPPPPSDFNPPPPPPPP